MELTIKAGYNYPITRLQNAASELPIRRLSLARTHWATDIGETGTSTLVWAEGNRITDRLADPIVRVHSNSPTLTSLGVAPWSNCAELVSQSLSSLRR